MITDSVYFTNAIIKMVSVNWYAIVHVASWLKLLIILCHRLRWIEFLVD